MENIKGELIKVAAEILVKCPVSTCVEDWDLPKYVSGRQLFFIQKRLDKLDQWLKDMCIKVRRTADSIETKPEQHTTRQG